MSNQLGATDLEFPLNQGGEDEGLGHAGIETYRHAPYAGAARETGQNSRDAAATFPVRITFDLLDLTREDIPAIEELQWTIKQCLRQVHGREKEMAFFRQAEHTASQPRIKVLRIADFNTTGARGPSVKGTPFHSLLKGSGVSVKDDPASGGSFGIGKNAVFAISDVQTVFYSTLYTDDQGGQHFLAQGKVILISHEDRDGEPRRQAGYWGRPGFQPVEDQEMVPGWMRRSELGTSLFVVGFRETAEWQRTFACSLMQNFFPAIASGVMEFHIDSGRFVLAKSSLAALFDDPGMLQAARSSDVEQDFVLARHLYECLVSTEAREDIIDLPDLGRVQVRVLVRDGLPKRVFVTRNGMVITDSLEHFGDKFSRFPMYKDFVALVTPVEDKGSALIKQLEDPKHRELSAERLPDARSRERVRLVMKRLAGRIRDVIKAHTLASFEKEVAVDEMKQYFSSPAQSSPSSNATAQDDPEKLRYEIRRKPHRSPAAKGVGAEEAPSGIGEVAPAVGPRKRGQNSEPGASGNAGRADGGSPRPPAIHLRDIRNVIPRSGDAKRRSLMFTTDASGDVEVSLFAPGLNTAEFLAVTASSTGAVAEGRIRTEVSAGERIRLDVEMSEEYTGPVDVVVSYRVTELEGGARSEA